MKKLFSVMLVVLALCGVASAFDIYIVDANTGSDDITVFPSDYITLLVYYTGVSEWDGSLIQQFDYSATVTGPGAITGGSVDANGRQTVYDMTYMPARDEISDFEAMGGRDDNGAVLAGLGNPLGKIYFHCDDTGIVTIALLDVATFDQAWNLAVPTMHGMTITQIPEPATIALLCLGGLLLRKKK